MVGIPRPPGFFRATGTVDSTAIADDAVGAVDVANTLIYDMDAKTDPAVTDSVMICDAAAANINKKATIANLAKATGEMQPVTDLFTIEATPDRIQIADNGATHLVATDVVTVLAFE
jgi:hypothetical protein